MLFFYKIMIIFINLNNTNYKKYVTFVRKFLEKVAKISFYE